MSLQSIVVVVAALLLAAIFLGRKSVHVEIDIPAPPSEVWTVLTNTDKYAEWNPVFVLTQGELEASAKLVYEVQETDSKTVTIPTTVKAFHPLKRINQVGGYKGILTFDHTYELVPIEQGTRLVIHEEYRGIWVHFWNPSDIQKQYEKLADALKNRVVGVN